MSFDTAVKSGPGSTELPRSPSPLVKADALLFAHFERPDLKKAEAYLLDFGLIPAGRTGNDLFLRRAEPLHLSRHLGPQGPLSRDRFVGAEGRRS